MNKFPMTFSIDQAHLDMLEEMADRDHRNRSDMLCQIIGQAYIRFFSKVLEDGDGVGVC